MPKLWSDTIAEHRRDVREAIVDAAWALATERGMTAVKMAHVAERSGIGRATLYKYFADVESILHAYHERHVGEHLARLVAIHDQGGDIEPRLSAALTLYARVLQRQGAHAPDLMNVLHGDASAQGSQQKVIQVFRDLLIEAAEAGVVRSDIAPAELATFCLHALGAARQARSDAAVTRVVGVTLGGLRP